MTCTGSVMRIISRKNERVSAREFVLCKAVPGKNRNEQLTERDADRQPKAFPEPEEILRRAEKHIIIRLKRDAAVGPEAAEQHVGKRRNAEDNQHKGECTRENGPDPFHSRNASFRLTNA